jgi:hypothetical protein
MHFSSHIATHILGFEHDKKKRRRELVVLDTYWEEVELSFIPHNKNFVQKILCFISNIEIMQNIIEVILPY